ncbi:unnamed protein product [Rotaria socialis]|uniref:Uncharacterized protein n=2 Tax=Rotaria socialis TaxID=392032 RepID=A0A817YAW4_9BILA|nr:unnamed protein product [Rotaria socialis]
MNMLSIFLTIAILLIGGIHSAPWDAATFADDEWTEQPTTTTTTTTTTLAPEFDREWEDLILGGPTVVNHLGLFMVLASRADQILQPAAGYQVQHIQNLQSLRATLTQIRLAMQNVFQTARDDHFRAQNSIQQIPEHIKAGLLLIQTAPTDLISKLLPYTMRNVERAADEGSLVTKPALQRFVSIGLLLEELVAVLNSTPSTPTNADYLVEAKSYAADISEQWNLLVDLFRKFSHRADITQTLIKNSFIEPINEAQRTNGFNNISDRTNQLSKLIPASILIDQSSDLLDMMIGTYTVVSNDHMVNQIDAHKSALNIADEQGRGKKQRELWQNILQQSIKVARLAQERQTGFAATSVERNIEYDTYARAAMAT